jgi:C-terminal processing protease CtpA/Prc
MADKPENYPRNFDGSHQQPFRDIPLDLMRDNPWRNHYSTATSTPKPEECNRAPLYDKIIDAAAQFTNDSEKAAALMKKKAEPKCFIKDNKDAQFYGAMELSDLGDQYTKLRTEPDQDPEKVTGLGLAVHDEFGTGYNGLNVYSLFGFDSRRLRSEAPLSKPPSISYVMENSPAANAGLKTGDSIVELNGVPYDHQRFTQFISLLGARSGQPIQMKVQHEGQVRSVDLETREFRFPLVAASDQGDNIVSLKLRSFSGSENDPALPAKELQQAILSHPEAKAFVLDLRNNPGGAFDNAIGVSELFIDDGVIVKGNGRDIGAKEFQIKPFTISVNHDTEFHDGESGMVQNDSTKPQTNRLFSSVINGRPVAVLVNWNSASASEIVAGALNETAGYPLIGTATFGKGIGQCVSDKLADGSRVQATCMNWLTPKGKWLGDARSNRHPLEPTIPVDPSTDASVDPQLNRALTYLHEQMANSATIQAHQ